MDIVLIGTNYKKSPLAIREKLSFSKKALEATYRRFLEENILSSYVILSTCNRVEIYGEVVSSLLGKSYLEKFLSEYLGHNEIDLSNYLYCLENEAAIRHLCRVVSGLDSQILGENQILGQVRDSYFYSKNFWKESGYLDEVFNKAIEIGKRVRKDTRISRGNVSIGTVAIKLLEEKLDSLNGLSILIIGAGKVTQLLVKYLKEEGIRTVLIANKTYEKAVMLARQLNGRAVRFDKLYEELLRADIVISSTSSPHVILKEIGLRETMALRQTPLFILDLAVPRDVEESIRTLPNITLYNIDDLACAVEANLNKREKEIPSVESIIDDELNRFLKNLWNEDALLSVQGQASLP